MSLTLSYFENAWDLVTLVLSCSKTSGRTTGEGLVGTIERFVNDYDLKCYVVKSCTDCEPSMATVSRTLTESRVFQRVGCTNHRFESTTSVVFNRPVAKKHLALATPSRPRKPISEMDMLDDTREPTPDKEDTDVSQARSMHLPCVQALLKDFVRCTLNIVTYWIGHTPG